MEVSVSEMGRCSLDLMRAFVERRAKVRIDRDRHGAGGVWDANFGY